MRSIYLVLVLASSLAATGCTAVNNFGDFSFGGGGGKDSGTPGGKEDGGPTEDMDASKSDPDSGMMVSTEKDSGPEPEKDSGPMTTDMDAGVDAGEPDSSVVVDPLCEAAGCHTDATCNSSSGTAICTCKSGFFGNGTNCNDLNECLSEPCPQEATCNNTPGTFSCDEKPGFDCQKNQSGDYECFTECFVLLSTVCDPAAASCSYPTGSGECHCKSGYKDVSPMLDGTDCVEDEVCAALVGVCHTQAICDATDILDPKCVCIDGYDGDGIDCLDVDECDLNTDDCVDESETCANAPGGFSCECKRGFTLVGDTCVDDNECTAGTDDCSNNATCTNTAGSFACECKNGFAGDGVTCDDIDECDLGRDDCAIDATCTNKAGGWTCECKQGYDGDGKSCDDIDECDLGTDDCGAVLCTNSPGSFTCGCPQGQQKVGSNCVDINECTEDLDNCSVNANCTNVTTGAPYFTCACKTGYSGDGIDCIDVDECDKGTDTCSSDATCTNDGGSYSCACKPGFTDGNPGNAGRTCNDVNECTQGTDNCNDDRGTCANTSGSFMCSCKGGYSGDGIDCIDLDECSLGTDDCDNSPDACKNSVGSYTCECPGGYMTTDGGKTCNDILTCATSNGGCDTSPMATCNEVVGSANTCTCPGGYMTTDGGKTCTDILTCATSNGGCDTSPMATCNEVAGGANTCTCPGGYTTTNGGVTCTDILTCATNNGGCDVMPMATCNEVLGAPNTCTCPSGYMTSDSGVTCTDILTCATNNGNCDTSPMATCNEVAGAPNTCTCPSGYGSVDGGKTCTDINECDTNNGGCGNAAYWKCTNNIGGAPTCSDVLTCATNNGGCDTSPMAACNEVGGAANTCTCPVGYITTDGGVTCVDWPCTYLNGGCDTAPTATCTNVDGALNTCTCPAGYSGDGQGGSGCANINECGNGTHRCSANAACSDTAGSYTCACNSGYIGNGYVCVSVKSTFPEAGASAAAKDVRIAVSGAANGTPTLQCRTYKRSGAVPVYGSCASPIANGGSLLDYAAWDPAWSAAGVTYSNNNRSITGNSAGVKNVRANMGKSSGKWYWEVTATAGSAASNNGGIGIVEAAMPNNVSYIGSAPSGMSFGYSTGNPTYWLSWGYASITSGQPPVNSAIAGGNTYMFALDMDTKHLWVGHNGTWYNGGNPATGANPAISDLTGTVYPGVTFYPNSGNAFTANFGTSTFAYAVPNSFSAGLSTQSSTHDGAWRTDIRWLYGISTTSAFSYDFYVHSSLHDAGKCPALEATDAAMFAAADTYLNASLVDPAYDDPGAFTFSTGATTLANPFVSIQYSPVSGGDFVLNTKFQSVLGGDKYSSELWSLRRRFVASSDGRYVLIRRVYGSRGSQVRAPAVTGGGEQAQVNCNNAATFEVADSNWGDTVTNDCGLRRCFKHYSCDAVVVNRAGAGVCINVASGGAITVEPTFSNYYGEKYGYSTSDKFMWRHLMEEDHIWVNATGYRLFSPKRNTLVGGGDAYELYLPDYGVLRP